MTALLYDRRIIVDVAGFSISDLRINIEISKEIDDTQVKGHANIYNLTPASEQRVTDRAESIRIQAGYPETLAILFEGFVQRIIKIREDLAHITQIHLGDSAHKAATLGGTFSRSYEGPVPVRQIAQEIISEGLMLESGSLDAIPSGATFTNFYWGGLSAAGALSAVLEPSGLSWFTEDDVIKINRIATPETSSSEISVTPQNGLIGSPTVTDEGVEIDVFLNPRCTLGSVIVLRSAKISGTYKIVSVRHSLDNWNVQNFRTTCDLREL